MRTYLTKIASKIGLEHQLPLCVGLIGLGNKGGDHLKAIQASPNVILRAVADHDEKTYAKLFVPSDSEIKIFQDYQEMLETTELDAVIVCVPHHLHFPILKQALKHRRHVLVEKPLTTNLNEAKLLEKLAHESDCRIMVATQRRFESSFALGKSLLPDVGRPFAFRYSYTLICDLDNLGWRGRKNLSGGGALLDMGYHAVDILNWYCGLPDEVYLQGGKIAKPDSPSEVEDTAILSFRYKKSLTGIIFLSRGISPEEEELKLNGDQGALVIKRSLIRLYKKGLVEPVVEIKESKSKEQIYTDQINHFADSILQGKDFVSEFGENIINMSIIEAAYLSLVEKRAINPHDLR